MNTKILISGVVVIGVVALGFFMFSNRADSPAEDQNGVSSQVPAPGNEGVDEMIVNPDGDGVMSDEDKTKTDLGVIIVTYTSDGFSPKDITIAQGETVRFVNESSRGVWPASAVHPIHARYPEKTSNDCLGSTFDACKILAVGASWDFTFNVIGKWGYHDHIRITKTGSITVE